MPGENRDYKISALIRHQNGRIRLLILYKRRNGADGDPGSAHKNQGIRLREPLAGPWHKAARPDG